MIAQPGAGETERIARRIVLQPNPVEIQIGVAAPSEPLERSAARGLCEVAAVPGSIRKSLTEVAHFDAVDPDRVLAVEGGHRVVQLHHLLDAGPLSRGDLDTGIVQKRVAPVLTVG